MEGLRVGEKCVNLQGDKVPGGRLPRTRLYIFSRPVPFIQRLRIREYLVYVSNEEKDADPTLFSLSPFPYPAMSLPQLGSLVDGGRLQLIDILGKGAYGVVFLAFDTLSAPSSSAGRPRYFAVKCVRRPEDPATAAAHLREMAIHNLVGIHPGIITLRRCIQEGPYTLFVMDFMEGGDLFKQIISKRLLLLFFYLRCPHH